MTRARSILILAWAVAAVWPALVKAEEGPMVIKTQEQRPTLSLDPFHGAVGFSGQYVNQTNKVNGQTAKGTDMLLTQDLTLGTGGAIVSKNLFTWTGAATLSLQQEWFDTGQQTAFQPGFFDAYHFELNAFNATTFPFTAWADQNQSLIDQPFAAMLRDTTTSYGATFHYNSGPLPSTLSYSHSSTTQSNLTGQNQFTIDQDDLEYGTSFQPFERQNVSINMHYATISQRSAGIFNSNSDLLGATVTHDWSLDPAGRYIWSEMFDYSQQSGNFPFTQYRLGEQLRLRFSDTLEGSLNYTLEGHDYPNTKTTRNTVIANVTHRLYESLTTSARVGGALTDGTFSTLGGNGDLSTAEFFTDMTMNYQKKVPLGRLGAHLTLGYSQTDNSPVGAAQNVLNEVHTFMDPQPIVLTRAGISPNSIAVFSADGTRRFIRNVDYTVKQVGQTVEIRQASPAIGPNDSVRLNYLVEPLPGYTSSNTTFGLGANYLFEEGPLAGLNLFANYLQVDQTISPMTSSVLPNSVRDTLVGAEYRFWKITLSAEYQMYDSTLAPYNAMRFAARYDDRLSDRTTLTIDATQDFLRYPTDDSNVSLTTIDGHLDYQITPALKAVLTARWRNDNDSRIGALTGFEEQLELRWRVRQTEMFGLVRHTAIDGRDNDQTTFFFQLGVSRSF